MLAQNRKTWNQTLKELESLHREGRMKEFYKTFNRLTHVGHQFSMVQELEIEESVVSGHDEVETHLADYFREIYRKKKEQINSLEEGQLN